MIPVATIFPATDEHLIQLIKVRLVAHTKRPYSKAYLNDSSEDRIQKWCSETGIGGKSWNEKCGPAQEIPVANPSIIAEGTIVYQLGQRLAIAYRI